MSGGDSDIEDISILSNSTGQLSFNENSSSTTLRLLDLANAVFADDSSENSDEESEDSVSTIDSISDEESESSISIDSSLREDELYHFLDDIDFLQDDDGNDYSEDMEEVFSDENNSNHIDGSSEQFSSSVVLGVPLSANRRKRRSSEAGDLKNEKKIRMDERENEKTARALQIEETKEFLKSTHLECSICLSESPEIKNPMFCAFCFKLVGCEPCCRKWAQVSKKNIVKRGSTCPLCRHRFSGSISSNLITVYITEVTI